MKGADARARVAQELEKNKKSERVRQWCAECLGEYGDPVFLDGLVHALGDKDLEVRRAAARALGKLRLDEGEGKGAARAASAVEALVKLHKDKDPILRANALEASACVDPVKQKAALLLGLKDKDAGVRCALLGAAGALFPDEAEALAVAALADTDWRPRMQAVELLSELRRRRDPHLIGALGDASGGRRAPAQPAGPHTGLKHGQEGRLEAWWEANGGASIPPRRRRGRAATTIQDLGAFNGIRLESDHVAFLIDKSQTMGADLTSQQCTKEKAARDELEATLSRLQGHLTFSLFTYANQVTPFDKKGAVELDPKSREKALAFVDHERLGGSKDVWLALETVLADPDVDTVFLLSSSEPEVGLYVHWNRVTWHLAELNRFHKLVVHSIAYSDKAGYREQLKKIAEVTGGEFKYFE
jgi:hypothetical protein